MNRRSERKESSLRGFYIVLALVAIAGIAWLTTQSRSATPTAQIVDQLRPGDGSKARGHVYGREGAPVEIAEFADFECPACGQFAMVTEPDVRRRLADAGRASFRFYDFPLPQHLNSVPASMAAGCAEEQGKFWEMHDQIFQGQPDWATKPGESREANNRRARRLFERYAQTIGLDRDRWRQCMDEQRPLAAIEANRQLGIDRKVQFTPTFIVGRRQLSGILSYDRLVSLVDSAAAARDTGAAARGTARP